MYKGVMYCLGFKVIGENQVNKKMDNDVGTRFLSRYRHIFP